MPDNLPEYGTLVIAALLLLALTFAGYWILFYVEPGHDPRALLPWFGGAAAAIVVAGILVFAARARGGNRE
jgi:hypothetical protein